MEQDDEVKMAEIDKARRSAERFLEACVRRDVDYIAAQAADDVLSSFSGVTTGSDPDWSLGNTMDHLRGLKPAAWAGLDLNGHVVGNVAWFTALSGGLIPTGETLSIRTTIIMRRIEGDWKAAHFHVSEPVDREGIALE